MKIYIANQSKKAIGGGWSFIRNFSKYLNEINAETSTVDSIQDADVLFISSASMITKELFESMKLSGKPIVLRVDNVLKSSRNRGAGMTRLLKYAKEVNLIIFQSMWAKEYVGDWLKRNDVDISNSIVIYNGTDTSIFYPPAKRPSFQYRYLFIKDKRFDEAAYHYHKKWLAYNECKLTIVGRFDKKLIEYNFDFFDHEKVSYLGQVTDPNTMATLMRNHDVLLFPAFADACPQTVVEALNCGLEVELVNDVGGTRELMHVPLEALSYEFMGEDYVNEIKKLV